MSQQIGQNFPTRIPVFGDDASIQEAFSVYHFGVDNYTSQPIPDNSIEGHFRSLNNRVSANESAIDALGDTFVEEVSRSSAPNIITGQTNTVVPLTIRGIQNQLADLQRWVNNDNNVMAVVFPNGAASFNSYLNVGSTTQSLNVGVNVSLANAGHKGAVVRGAVGQTANLQEWQNSSEAIVARVDNLGRLYSENIQVVTLSQSQTLTNKTLTAPTINNATIGGTTTISNANINGSSINNAVEITLSGSQAVIPQDGEPLSRVRNIRASTGNPSGGNDGDIWVRYIE